SFPAGLGQRHRPRPTQRHGSEPGDQLRLFEGAGSRPAPAEFLADASVRFALRAGGGGRRDYHWTTRAAEEGFGVWLCVPVPRSGWCPLRYPGANLAAPSFLISGLLEKPGPMRAWAGE